MLRSRCRDCACSRRSVGSRFCSFSAYSSRRRSRPYASAAESCCSRDPAWGYATAASTLVGQSLGADDPKEATAYGWQSLGVALAVQLAVALLLVVFARPIVSLFGTAYPDLAATFVRVFGLHVAGFSFPESRSLRGARDTRWPL